MAQNITLKIFKMFPNPIKERYSLNKIHYFSYHAQVADAFQKDCDKFLLAFQRVNDLSFVAFSEVWKKLHFDLVFSGQELIEEQTFFVETCFFTAKKYVVFSQNVSVQVGALYMLYAFYYKQTTPVKVKIRCTCDDFSHLSKLVAKMRLRDVNDVAYIFTKLKIDNAFRFVALPRVCALEGKFMWQERKMANNIFDTIKKGNPVYDTKSVLFSQEFYGLNCFYDVGEDYARGLEKYGFPKRDCERITSLPEEIEALCKEMESKSDENATAVAIPGQASIKKRAFATQVKSVR